jgi:hypothetical protein
MNTIIPFPMFQVVFSLQRSTSINIDIHVQNEVINIFRMALRESSLLVETWILSENWYISDITKPMTNIADAPN